MASGRLLDGGPAVRTQGALKPFDKLRAIGIALGVIPIAAGGAGAVGLAELSATVWLTTPSAVNQAAAEVGVGFTFTVTAEVMNPGQETANYVGPTDAAAFPATCGLTGAVAVAGAGAVAWLAGPSPDCTVNLAPGQRTFFTWIYRADVRGVADLTVSTSGRQSSGGPTPIADATRADTAVLTIRDAELTLDVGHPLRATVGQANLPVVARVTNGGLAAARGVFALSYTVAGCPQPAAELAVLPVAGGSVTFESVAGPSCAFDLAPGASQAFTWYFTASRSGTIGFTATCTGFTTANAFSVSAADSSPPSSRLLVQEPPRLGGVFSASPSWSVPYRGEVTVWLDVANAGEATAAEVAPAPLVLAGPGGLTALACPPVGGACPVDASGAGATEVPGSETRRFTWVFRADAPGTLTVTGAAAGVDQNTRAAAASPQVSLPLRVEPPALLSLTVTGGRELIPGSLVKLTVSVVNPGATPIVQSAFTARLNGDASLLVLVSADPPVPRRYEACDRCGGGLALGCCRYEYALTYRVSESAPAGPTTLEIGITGADLTGLAAVSAGAAVPVMIYPASSRLAGIGENPFRPAAGVPVEFTFIVAPEQGGGPVSVRIHALSGGLVWVLHDAVTEAGVWRASWDGRNVQGQRVASGVYLVHFTARGTRSTARLAVIQ